MGDGSDPDLMPERDREKQWREEMLRRREEEAAAAAEVVEVDVPEPEAEVSDD